MNGSFGVKRAHILGRLCKEYGKLQKVPILDQLTKIQCALQDINAAIATPKQTSSEAKIKRTEFDPTGDLTKELEGWIDSYDAQLPKLTRFILPVRMYIQ